MNRIGLLAVLLALLAGCGSADVSAAMGKQFETSGTVDLRLAAAGPWERVCVLGPYSSNQAALRTLGFAWPVERHSAVRYSDAISLLVFVRGTEVLDAVEHPRRIGDFAGLSGRCFSRDAARFIQVATPATERPGLVPQDDG